LTTSLLLERDVSLLGVQTPRLRHAPPSVSSAGPEAVALAASAGLVLDPWQALSLEVMLGERADGLWSAFEFAELVARQNGKGGVLEARSLAGLFLLGERLILHSAHEFKTSKEAYLRIRGLIEGAPHLVREVKQFRQSNEDTSVELKSGARLRFMARSRSSGRGFSAQTLLVDEAQILSEAAMGALLPTLAAQANPQIVYTGTVPQPDDNSEHFESLRDRGRAGGDASLAWLEWNVGESCDDIDDREAWAAANPALGYRVSEEFIERERASLSDESFARERLSIWPTDARRSDIDQARWAQLEHQEDERPAPIALTVAVSEDHEWSHVCLAGRRQDGNVQVLVVQSARGTGWVPGRMAELVATYKPVRVMVNGAAAEGSLLTALDKAGVAVELATAREVAQASGAFADAITHGTVRHLSQGQLNLAVRVAGKKPQGEAWVWRSNEADIDIAPLRGVTLALHALVKTGKAKKPGSLW
jgi:hypothetical protein